MTLSVATQDSLFSDGDVVGGGSGTVFVEYKPIARLDDLTTGHTPPGHTFFPPAKINSAAETVFADNKPIARVKDTHAPHTDSPHPSAHTHSGVIVTGSGTVFSS